MQSTLIVGIVSTSDPKEVKELVMATGMDAARTKVLSTRADEDDPSVMFLEVAQLTHSDGAGSMTRHTGVLSDFGGTSVPGLSALTSLAAFSHPRVRDYVGGMTIPAAEAERYNDAVADGRCVVLYTCTPDEAADAKSAIRQAGAIEVRSYPS